MKNETSSIVLQIAAKAVIANDEGSVLLVRESPAHATNTKAGRYHLPGGRIEPGESFFDGLAREVMEETGLTLSVGEPLLIGEWRPIILGVPHQIVGVFIASTLIAGTVRLSEEHDSFLWINPQEYEQYDIVLPDRDALAAYVAKSNPHSTNPRAN
jgi:8-oxo-dGTP diphosphatase